MAATIYATRGVVERLMGFAQIKLAIRLLRQCYRYGLGRWLQANWWSFQRYQRYKTVTTPAAPHTARSILVIDGPLLRPDDSSLGRSYAQQLTLLQQMGWRVFLWLDEVQWDGSPEPLQNVQWDEPYALALEEQGVALLAGFFLRRHSYAWLQANAAHFDYVLFRWPQPLQRYGQLLRNHTAAKLLLLSPDLHALRHQRHYVLTGDQQAQQAAQALAQQEAQLFPQVDAVLTYSQSEATWLRQQYGEKIFTLPLFWYDQQAPPRSVVPPQPQLLFVGNLSHPPNSDGLDWFVRDCLPLLCQQCPTIQVLVVGVLWPVGERRWQCEQVTMLGKVSDTALAALYQQARVAVVPLRFGSGVKGKVIEALAHGLPVVTTTCGAEGVPGLAELVGPVETPVAMAEAILHLLRDDVAWQHHSAAGQAFVQQHFSVAAAQASFTQLFTWLEATA